MKILITGVHGFVGSNLVEYLKKEHVIYGIDIVRMNKDGLIKTYSWDDIEQGNLPDCDAIIHLAGKAHDIKNKSLADEYFNVNVGLTKRIFDHFISSSARKFIFFSSAKAVADKLKKVLTEDVVPNPVGPYGESKIKAEQYILSKYNEFLTNQIHSQENKCKNHDVRTLKQVYILRPCMIHGPGNKGNLNLLIGVVQRGVPWPLGAFENKRTFTSIDNVTFLVNGLLFEDAESGTYNIGDDNPLSTNELVGIICEVMGKRTRVVKVSPWIIKAIAKLGDLFCLPLSSDRLQKLTENYVASNDKIKKALRIEQMPVSSREGLVKTIRCFCNTVK